MLMALVVMGGDPATGRGGGGAECFPTAPGLSAERHSRDTIKKLVLLLVPSQLQLFNPNIHAGFKALLEPLRGQEPSTLQTKTRTPQA